MSYRNLHLTPHDREFKEKYKSVIDAVGQLETHGEVEVTFTTHNGLLVWRRRCYEYQKITGKTFRIEVGHGYTLVLRPRKRRPVGDYGLVSITPHHPLEPGEESQPPDADGVIVTEADLALAKKVLDRLAKKEGADEPGGPDPRGDAVDTGSDERGD